MMDRYIKKPDRIIQDKRLSATEKDYLCLIGALEKHGGCTASNSYFANFFGVKRQTAQEMIRRLKDKDFIDCKEKKCGGKTIERTIWIIDEDSRKALLSNSRNSLPSDSRKSPAGLAGNHLRGWQEITPPNNKGDNKDSIVKREGRTRFIPPTVDEVRQYAKAIEYDSLNAEKFVAHYEASGWMRGKSKMRDWRAAVRYWKQADEERNNGNQRKREFKYDEQSAGEVITV